MKNYLKLLALAAIAITACSKETAQIEVSPSKDPLVLKAHYGQTKSTVTDAGKFGWSETDTISVYTRVVIGNRPSWGFEKYVLQSGAGTPDAEFFGAESTANVDKVAVLPSSVNPSLSGNALTLTLPEEYDYAAGETNVPMIAQVTDGKDTDLSFKHLGGLLKLIVNNVPSEASFLYFIVPGKKITGEFTVDDYSAEGACIEAEDSNNNNFVYINIDSSEEDMTFYIPLPVGEYPDGFMYAFFDSYGDMCSVPAEYEKAFTVERADLLLAPEDDTWIIDIGYFMLVEYDGAEKTEQYGWVQNISFYTAGNINYKVDVFGPIKDVSPSDVSYYEAQYFAEMLADSDQPVYSDTERSLMAVSDPGVYVALMLMVDEDGNSLNRFSYTAYEVYDLPEEASEGFNKWIGTWSISGIDYYDYSRNNTTTKMTFNGVTLSEYLPDRSFTVAHWETNVEPEGIQYYNWDTALNDPLTFKANYDVETGQLQFIANQPLVSVKYSESAYGYAVFNDFESQDHDDGDILAVATLSEDGQSATVSAKNGCVSLGVVLTDAYYNARYLDRWFNISPESPVPVTMTKTSDATSAPAAPGVKQASASVVKKARTVSLPEGVSAPAAFKAAPARVSKNADGLRTPKSFKVLSGNLKK